MEETFKPGLKRIYELRDVDPYDGLSPERLRIGFFSTQKFAEMTALTTTNHGQGKVIPRYAIENEEGLYYILDNEGEPFELDVDVVSSLKNAIDKVLAKLTPQEQKLLREQGLLNIEVKDGG